jgi:hypothetical protein
MLAVFCGLMILGMAASVLVWFFVSVWSGGAAKKSDEDRARLQADVAGARITLDDIEKRIHGSGPAPSPTPLTRARRSEALRLARHGRSPEEIAAELGVPLQELVVLLKVHRLIMQKL